MKNRDLKWEVLGKLKAKSQKPKAEDIVDILLKNRGLKTKKQKEEFLKPTPPFKISLRTLGIRTNDMKKAVARISQAIKGGEQIVIYGDYDADGVCATAILWRALYDLTKKVLPHIPDRFSEGYGINSKTVAELKEKYPDLSLIVTVDNGIVAFEAIDEAKELGVDVIITDHHTKGKKVPKAHSIIHTENLSGAGLAWFFAREIKKGIGNNQDLDLAAIGTISDQVPLIGANRSIAKHGLAELNKTKNIGLKALIKEATVKMGEIGTYEVGFIIAPRINAMGRMEQAVDALRLLCTKNRSKASELARVLGRTNLERQKILDEVISDARIKAEKKDWEGVILLTHESYHEGVIGLAASKLVEEFYRPAIVIAKGVTYSKASARSISGFNITETVKKLESLLVGVGGHPMAAGFSIETEKIAVFEKELTELSKPLLTEEILSKRLKIDLELGFNQINWSLVDKLSKFDPCGVGNPRPVFATKEVNILNARTVGKDSRHLKLMLEKNGKVFSAIAFNMGDLYMRLIPENFVDIAYNISVNVWNGRKDLELIIKDIKFDNSN